MCDRPGDGCWCPGYPWPPNSKNADLEGSCGTKVSDIELIVIIGEMYKGVRGGK